MRPLKRPSKKGEDQCHPGFPPYLFSVAKMQLHALDTFVYFFKEFLKSKSLFAVKFLHYYKYPCSALFLAYLVRLDQALLHVRRVG